MRTNYPTREIGREIDYTAIKRQALVDQKIAVIDLKRLPWHERELVEAICRRQVGGQRA